MRFSAIIASAAILLAVSCNSASEGLRQENEALKAENRKLSLALIIDFVNHTILPSLNNSRITFWAITLA